MVEGISSMSRACTSESMRVTNFTDEITIRLESMGQIYRFDVDFSKSSIDRRTYIHGSHFGKSGIKVNAMPKRS